jgi:predicted RNase H-like HicB family nuclease
MYLLRVVTYRAMYEVLDDGVHAEVLDFPGVISCGKDLEEAREYLRSALVDMAETNLARGEPLPKPNPAAIDPESDLEEPIHQTTFATPRPLPAFRGASSGVDPESESQGRS